MYRVANPVQALQVKDVLEIIWEEARTTLHSSEVPIWKRGLDIACILLALPALGLLFSLIALWIKLVSRGPILFRQERVGLGGRTFVCLKFRCMKVGADTQLHKDYLTQLLRSETPMTKMDVNGDPRLIPLGALLRSTGLDELPQLINVLRGDMSLVGPRPCIPYEAEDYRPWQKERFNGLPGSTGLWQVSGKNKTTFDEMIHLDISYLRSKSIGLDLGIILKTVPALIVQVKELLTQLKDPVKQKSISEEQPYYGQTN